MTVKTLQLGLHWFPERQGGLDRVYYELSRALPAAGVEFIGLVAGSDRIEVNTNGEILAFAPSEASMLRRWLGLRRSFSRLLKWRMPDLIVSHFSLYTLPILYKLGKLPLVVHFHGPWADEGSVEGNTGARQAVKRWIENLVYRRAGHAIVLSNAFAEVLSSRYKFPRERIHVIPGGIDPERFLVTATLEEARTRLNWPLGRPTIIAVRRLVPRMGLENLLLAMESIRQKIPDVLLMIAGRGVLHGQLAEQIESRGLTNNVRLLGFVSDKDLAFVYRAADLSVVPTVALEGFGLIAAESLASGTPCLVSPIGGLPEVVAGLSTNLVLASPAPADIAEAVTAALLGELILPNRESCSAYAMANYDWKIIATQVADVYRQAIR